MAGDIEQRGVENGRVRERQLLHRILHRHLGLLVELVQQHGEPRLGGNLGNSSAFGKAFFELKSLGLISKLPRLAVINAAGAWCDTSPREESRGAD